MKTGGLRKELLSGAVGSIVLKLTSVFLGLVLSIMLARSLGTSGYGLYAYVFSLVMLISIPIQLGLPNLLVRETAKAQVNLKWGLMRGLWRWATITVGGLSILMASIALVISILYSERFSSEQLTTFSLGLVLIPLLALGNIRGAALRGLRHVVMGQLPEILLRPGILILLLAVTMYVWPESISPSFAMGLHVIAAAVAFFIGAFMLWKVRPTELAIKPKPEYAIGEWLTSALPLAMLSGMSLINQNTDIIMLGYFQSADEVGVYKVAVIGATFVAFGLQAIVMVITPHFAHLYTKGDIGKLQQLVTLSTRAIVLLSIPVVLLFVFYGEVLLLYAFGNEYTCGAQPLAILAVGQFINTFMGPVAALLTMTGHEKDTARGVAISAGVNVVLNLILIPLFGMSGAAVATALSLMAWNIILWKSVHNRLGIESMAFNFLPVKI